MNDFLPKGYETPEIPSSYMDFEEGLNSFRIVSSAIVGYEWWTDNGGQRKPVRVRTEDEVPAEVKNTLDSRQKARHFWAFVVYNYKVKSIQVLEIKQQTIMRALEAFINNPKWGNPKNYDIVIEKTRYGSRERDVEYSVIPEPPAQLDPGVAELVRQVPVRLEALYDGGNPFAESDGQEKGQTGKAQFVKRTMRAQ